MGNKEIPASKLLLGIIVFFVVFVWAVRTKTVHGWMEELDRLTEKSFVIHQK